MANDLVNERMMNRLSFPSTSRTTETSLSFSESSSKVSSRKTMRWLMDAEERLGKGLINEHSLFCAAARVGSERQALFAGYPDEVAQVDLGPPLHCLVMVLCLVTRMGTPTS